LVDPVKEIFTSAKIWKLLGTKTYEAPSLDACIKLIDENGANIQEAKDRAAREGRNVNEEEARWNDLLGRA